MAWHGTLNKRRMGQTRGHMPCALLRLWPSGIDYVPGEASWCFTVCCDAIRSLPRGLRLEIVHNHGRNSNLPRHLSIPQSTLCHLASTHGGQRNLESCLCVSWITFTANSGFYHFFLGVSLSPTLEAQRLEDRRFMQRMKELLPSGTRAGN